MASQSKASDDGVEIGNLRIEPTGPGGVKLTGEIDLSNAERVHEAIAGMIPEEGNFSVDLADLRFIDSTGMAGLLSICKALGATGRLTLRALPPAVSKATRILGLDRVPNLELTPAASQANAAATA